MQYREFKPRPELSEYIKCYWSLTSDEDQKHSRERVFPDGCMELIFHFGDLFKKFTGKNDYHVQPRSFIHGQLRKFMELEATGRIGVFSARFYPAGLQPFLHTDVGSFTDSTLSILDALGEEGLELENTIVNAISDERRVKLVEEFLLGKLRSGAEQQAYISHCVNAIMNLDGNIVVEDLAAELKIGKRQLERKFASCVGLSPKHLARIVRFNKALQLIENHDFSSFTSAAHEGGFYDQAHFIKDFKELTGLNPKKYFSENLEMAKFFNLE